MNLRPTSPEDLSRALAEAHAQGRRVTGVDFTGLSRVLAHTPEDMTVTVETGITLAELQRQLAARGQWLPIDPPHPARLTLARLLAENLSGPRRCGHGTIRDHLLGVRAALADGRLIRSGGKVVKNVAGYDLLKLFIGAHDSLGCVVEATFKLLPLPEAERLVSARFDTATAAAAAVNTVRTSELTPVILDLHNLDAGGQRTATLTVVLGFAGAREDVEWQLERAAALGFTSLGDLDCEELFWADSAGATPQRLSVLPSRLGDALATLGEAAFVSRAGNGVLYHRGGRPAPAADVPRDLMRRLKDTFDPKGVLPELPL